MNINKISILLSFLFIIFTSCKDNERDADSIEMEDTQEETFDDRLEDARGHDDVVNAVEGNPELSTFAVGLNAWNVQNNVRDSEKNIIVFAPTNIAYSRTNQRDDASMIEIDAEEIISYHIIETQSDIAALKKEIRNSNNALEVETLQGEPIKLGLQGNVLMVTGATGVSAQVTDSLQAGDGWVYIIDKVLFPRDISRDVIITDEE